jgi:hypothetical protein
MFSAVAIQRAVSMSKVSQTVAGSSFTPTSTTFAS